MLTFLQRLSLAFRILFARQNNLFKHAADELAYVRKSSGLSVHDPLQDAADLHVLEMVACFCTQGHSAISAHYSVERLQKLLLFKALAPLTGHASEWTEISKGLWQNRRCSTVFKDAEKSWDIDAIVFRRPDGLTYTTGASRAYIQFPYIPKKRYIEVAH